MSQKIERKHLLTNNLKICENCEWYIYDESSDKFPKCLLDNEQKGLFEYCNKFKEKTGNHISM